MSHDVPVVGVIIIHYRSLENVIECVASVRHSTYPQVEIIVVDNNSGWWGDLVKAFPDVALIPSSENRGFAGGNNLGLEYARKKQIPYVFLLNDDAVIQPDAIRTLVAVFDRLPDAGSVQPLILNYYDRERIDSAGQRLLSKGGAEDIVTLKDNSEVQEIFGPCAAAAMYRREVLDRLGNFDESFFLIHEDTDLSFRMRLANYRCYLIPSARAYHKRGVSGSSGRKDPRYVYYNGRNLTILLLKYWPWKYLWLYFPIHIVRLLWVILNAMKCRLSVTGTLKVMAEAVRQRQHAISRMQFQEMYSKWMAPRGYWYFFRLFVRKILHIE